MSEPQILGKNGFTKHENFYQQLNIALGTEPWGEDLLSKVEVNCELPAGYYKLLFPGGINEVIDKWLTWQDRLMLEQLSLIGPNTKIRDKIGTALKLRIKNCAPKYTHIKNAVYFLLPYNLNLGPKFAFRTCNIIWRYAGDTATDFNYYTKRGLLLTVYVNAILFYINDNSKDNIDTDNFIDTSLHNIIKLGSLKKNFKIENIPFLRMLI